MLAAPWLWWLSCLLLPVRLASANLQRSPLRIHGAFVLTGNRFSDNRGFFQELYNEQNFQNSPITKSWKQISMSQSKPDTIRGFHRSNYAKYVQCVNGRILDVIVDLRPDSPTFLKTDSVWLSADEPRHVYIPTGCGHAFFAKTQATVLYFQDGSYDKSSDLELNLFDPTINFSWPEPQAADYVISDKDRANPTLAQIQHLLQQSRSPLLHRFPEEAFYADQPGKILVYGACGFLGSYVITELINQRLPFAVGQARLEDRQDLMYEIRRINPARIICFAGVRGNPNISWCDQHRVETIRANLVGQLVIADLCEQLGIHCTLITSGSIYRNTGDDHLKTTEGFTEEDVPNNSSLFYWRLRIIEEELLRNYNHSLVLRVNFPVTADLNSQSLVMKLAKFERVHSGPLSITVVDDLWPILLELGKRAVVGVFNFTNDGSITHDEILRLYRDIVDPNHHWVLENNLPEGHSRGHAKLNVDKLKRLGFAIPNIKDSMLKIMSRLKDLKDQAQRQAQHQLTHHHHYTPKNILLTGGAGFIGSHVAAMLVKKYPNYRVVVLDSLEYCSSMNNLSEIVNAPNFHFVKGNIRDYDTVDALMRTYSIDTVMHFAAQSDVDLSMKCPIPFSETNILGTHVLAENARLHGVRRFVHVSTDEVYGSTGETPDPNQPLDPTNPYACSKAAAEYVLMAYQKCYGLPVIVTRGNNVYGPHQFLEKLIPKFITRLGRGLKCCIHGDGTAERDFVYVSDLANAFDTLLHRGVPNDIYNIAAPVGYSVLEVAQKLVRLLKNTEEFEKHIEFVEERLVNDKRYKIDSSKITRLGWKPRVNFDDGLQLTINWYLNHDGYWPDSEYALEAHPTQPIEK